MTKIKTKKARIILLTGVVIILLAVFFGTDLFSTKKAEAGWYSTGGTWSSRRTITIDHTKVATDVGTETYANFPMLFNSTDSDLKFTGSGGNVGIDDGTDILFTTSNGTTKLSHEIEYYASTTGQVVAWVNLGTNLSSTTDTVIYIYYGNSGASDQQDATNVWGSNYKGVWHLGEGDSTAANFYEDSTVNVNHGQLTDADGDVNSASGTIYNGMDFNGDDNTDNINFGSGSTVDNMPNTTMTLSTWMRPDSYGMNVEGNIACKKYSYGWYFYVDGTSSQRKLALGDDFGGSYLWRTTNDVLTWGSWVYATLVYDGSSYSNTPKIFINGNEVAVEKVFGTATGGRTSDAEPTYNLTIGNKGQDSGREFDGVIDEFRVSSGIGRSADWIKTEYNNQGSPSTFYTLGSGEYTPVLRDSSVAGIKVSSQSSSLTWYATGGTWGYRKAITVDHAKVSDNDVTVWSVDKVTGGTATAKDQINSPGGEQPPNAADDNDSTKWLEFKSGGTPFWWQYDFGSGVAWKIGKYSITTVNDAEERDPKTWVLQGSNTGSFSGEEVTIDTVEDGALPSGRGVTQEFIVDSPSGTTFRYYRITISDLKNLTTANSVQVAEFRMYEGNDNSLTSFPMLFSVTDANLKSTGNGGKVGQTDGGDILFTNRDGTKLSHEIEKYTPTTGELVAWVKVPFLSSTSTTEMYVYFGDDDIADQWDATNVWDSNFKGVWHLGENSRSTAANFYQDSTSNNNDLTLVDADGDVAAVSGAIGPAINLVDEAADCFITASNIFNPSATDFSVSAWVKFTDTTGDQNLFAQQDGSGAGRTWLYKATTTKVPSSYIGGSASSGTTVMDGSGFYYLVLTKSGTTLTIYLNGVFELSSTKTSESATGIHVIGAHKNTTGNGLRGIMDEPRISSSLRSSNWIATEYNNQSSPSTFYAYGGLESQSRVDSSSNAKPAVKVRGGVKFR